MKVVLTFDGVKALMCMICKRDVDTCCPGEQQLSAPPTYLYRGLQSSSGSLSSRREAPKEISWGRNNSLFLNKTAIMWTWVSFNFTTKRIVLGRRRGLCCCVGRLTLVTAHVSECQAGEIPNSEEVEPV